jgi:hypothetical protein
VRKPVSPARLVPSIGPGLRSIVRRCHLEDCLMTGENHQNSELTESQGEPESRPSSPTRIPAKPPCRKMDSESQYSAGGDIASNDYG